MRIFYMTNIPWKTSHRKIEPEEGEINGETEMDETSEGN